VQQEMSQKQKDFESCVATKVEQGMSREEAEAACKQPDTEEKAKKALEEEQVRQLIERAVKTNDLTAFGELIKQVYQLKAEQLRGDIAKASVGFMEKWKGEILAENIEAIKASLSPTKKTPLYKEDLAQALREFQLEQAKPGKTSELGESAGDIAKGVPEHPGTVKDFQTRVAKDLDKIDDRFSAQYAPKVEAD